jgi:energy-coupling factor transporter transmembrane protein EcfT
MGTVFLKLVELLFVIIFTPIALVLYASIEILYLIGMLIRKIRKMKNVIKFFLVLIIALKIVNLIADKYSI